MAPSTSNLKQLLEYQSKCERLEMFDGQGQLVLIVAHFIIKLCSEDDEIIILLKSLDDSAKLCWSFSRHSEEDRKFSTIFWDFIKQLQVFFEVPKFNSTANMNEQIAAFHDLLLEILEEILHLQPYFIHGSVMEFILALKMELKFLITFLGDTPSQLTELETTKNVLKDIEVVANEVGSFLYSFFLSKDPISIAAMNNSLSDLLRNVERVKESINKHCVTVANLWPSHMTPSTATVSLSFVDSILDYIGDLVNRNDDRIVDVKIQIRTIHQNLMNLKNGIKELEIERHQEREEFSMQLINVAYEVEYIINSFAPLSYVTLRLLQVTEKIKPMGMQLQELKKNDARMLKDAEYAYPRQRISFQDHIKDEYLVGLKDEEMEIMDRLCRREKRLQIISITGMPGLGKTTLANRLYNNPMIINHFHRRIWCVVSRTYQRRNILIDILMSIDTDNKEQFLNMEDEMLTELIFQYLKGKRYIIIMDAIWNVNAWDDIKRCFPDDRIGSKILITSRNMNVASSNYRCNFSLRLLREDESWNLLLGKVFNKERCPPELVDVVKKIARNCGGLPITVVMIASVLKNLEKKRSLWMEVAENITSYICKETNEYMSVLEESYNDLPMRLKPCFLYFGIFEKEREIPVKKLIMLWHAEGFIGKVEDKSSEDVAQEYLMDLIDRSLLLIAKRKSDGGIKSCTILGAIHDMCSRLAEKDNFVKAITDRLSIHEQHLRLSIHSHSIPSFLRPFGLHIRSLLGHLPGPSAFIFSSLKHLKVLDLSSTDLSLYNLSGSEVLAFLRFLAVSSVPSSIEIFKNLEFLFVDNKEVVEIPVILLNMVKLRRVHFSGGAQFSESWRQATHDESFQISNLQNLSSIFIYDENDEKILRSFPHLRILKCKYTTFWDSTVNCYRYPALNNLYQLESLNISFRPSYESDDISPELINLPSNLKKLTLRNFDLSRMHMKIIGELPYLEVLKLRDNTIGGKGWDTNEGEFRRLKYLELDAVQIEHWNVSDDDFLILERLVLRSCQLLKEIPFSLGVIPTLEKIEVHGCAESVEASALQIREEVLDYGIEFVVTISRF
ncbi:putative late blight resistance protein homolog R1A-3 [Olea europaea var. sylvestris]|uniref:putative late blight resistance protein homolog R1A-3 n=1 Tax=Olea europaea var. sylvestris TaxID=158386 RepID=UPI000C1CDF2B|nr:putative late blight resistance protein homolog R1A-3 [Olea europaea var. sylvestris]XP_022841556.1 putative late blight resistance protein homolog R1A-3 [Olea europaea var. sylvestris]XP_022841557.1 putative late blight resistance protein homolog R1A-3 [Olea europaea var. sylvestris]XP_022841558.1 putative late blight resistance protein homolog R1A-3 [Olea europaea var. sylvestris]XP_022841559.1 putative late blight resistance protein homolog R1A-3 [Olea europaea var. sylvestris]